MSETPFEVPQSIQPEDPTQAPSTPAGPQPGDTPVNGGTTVTGAAAPDNFINNEAVTAGDVATQAKAALTSVGFEVRDVEQILSVLSENGLTLQTAVQVAGDVAADVKADPQVVEHAKSALSDFGHAAQDVEEFVAHLFHRGFTIVHTGQGKVEAPTEPAAPRPEDVLLSDVGPR